MSFDPIFWPCPKEELEQMVEFVKHGKVKCVDEKVFSKTLENLISILGFPSDLDLSKNFSFANQNGSSVNRNSFQTNTSNEVEVAEVTGDFFDKWNKINPQIHIRKFEEQMA